MKKIIIIFILLCPFLGLEAKKYAILDPGDPDLTAEKKASHNFDPILEENVNKKPFPITNSQTFFERGVLRKGHRVCFVGDTGNASKRQKLIALLMEKNCDQIRHLGDLIYYVGVKDMQDPLLKERFLDVYKDLSVPMYIALGNHDYYQNPDVWLTVSKQYPKKYIFPNHYYLEFFSLPGKRGLCFLTLDTTPINDAKSVNAPRVKAQLLWLDSISGLIKNRCTKTFSFSHHPFIPPQEGRDEKTNPMVKVEVYEKRLMKFVDMIVAGHDHYLAYYEKLPNSLFKGQFHKISEIVSGTGGMLNVESPIANRDFGKVFRDTGFVQMTFSQSSDDPNLRGTIKFINHLGKELLITEGP